MAYRMAQLLMISSDVKVTFAVLNLCNAHNSGNTACFNYSMFTHKAQSESGL